MLKCQIDCYSNHRYRVFYIYDLNTSTVIAYVSMEKCQMIHEKNNSYEVNNLRKNTNMFKKLQRQNI